MLKFYYIFNSFFLRINKKIKFMSTLFLSFHYPFYRYVKPEDGKKYEELVDIPPSNTLLKRTDDKVKFLSSKVLIKKPNGKEHETSGDISMQCSDDINKYNSMINIYEVYKDFLYFYLIFSKNSYIYFIYIIVKFYKTISLKYKIVRSALQRKNILYRKVLNKNIFLHNNYCSLFNDEVKNLYSKMTELKGRILHPYYILTNLLIFFIFFFNFFFFFFLFKKVIE